MQKDVFLTPFLSNNLVNVFHCNTLAGGVSKGKTKFEEVLQIQNPEKMTTFAITKAKHLNVVLKNTIL